MIVGNQFIKCTLEEFCIQHDKNLLELWDYELNNDRPSDIGYSSNKKRWFKCPKGIHPSREIYVGNITKAYKNGKKYCICHKCNSIGQYIVDHYGDEYLKNIWSDINDVNPFDIENNSKGSIWLKCINNITHPDYSVSANNFHKSHNCPYCSGKKVCTTNSFGYMYPEYIELWSKKNSFSPYDCSYGSDQYVWFKCENKIHNDYKKTIYNQTSDIYKCPLCANITRINNIPRGENSPYWKGDAVDKNKRFRNSNEYDSWRKTIFKNDNYTCQCCGQYSGDLQVHHIKDFATYEDLRVDIKNGITLCKSCHDSTVSGSFHNTYGTIGKKPEELEEYINTKRKQLNINIPFSIEAYLSGNKLKPNDVNNDFEYPWIFDLYPIRYIKNCGNHQRIAV